MTGHRRPQRRPQGRVPQGPAPAHRGGGRAADPPPSDDTRVKSPTASTEDPRGTSGPYRWRSRRTCSVEGSPLHPGGRAATTSHSDRIDVVVTAPDTATTAACTIRRVAAQERPAGSYRREGRNKWRTQ